MGPESAVRGLVLILAGLRSQRLVVVVLGSVTRDRDQLAFAGPGGRGAPASCVWRAVRRVLP